MVVSKAFKPNWVTRLLSMKIDSITISARTVTDLARVGNLFINVNTEGDRKKGRVREREWERESDRETGRQKERERGREGALDRNRSTHRR